MAPKKTDQPVRGGDIGANRVRRPAALACQMVVPALRDSGGAVMR
jgi:hypothetical protein